MTTRYDWLDDHLDDIVARYEAGDSLRDIAAAFDVTPPTIRSRLVERDVHMRNGGRTHARLENRVEDLVDQYTNQDQSLQALADHYETSVAAIRFHLETAGVDCPPTDPRTTAVGFHPAQLSVIEGELLGDGCLHHRQTGSYIFQLSTTTKAHARHLMDTLPDGLFPETQPSSFTRSDALGEGAYTTWRITSRPQPLFGRLYDDWYEVRDQHNRKVVPDDFQLDRTALLHWYWGDGSCSIRESGAPRVSFATHGFPEPSVRHLQSELDRLGYDNYAVEQQKVDDGSGLYIRLRDYDARIFLADVRRLNILPQYDHKFPVPVN